MRYVLGALAVAYPFAVWAGLRSLDARLLGALLGALLLVRGVFALRSADATARRRLLAPLVSVGALTGGVVLLNDARLLLLLPALVSALLGLQFAQTLRRGPSMVETFARLQVADLPEDEVRYCRSVTIVWCVFLAANAAVCVGLAWAAPVELWALYTGVLAYLGMGALLVGELFYRYWRFRRYAGAPTDAFFRRIFPPRPSPAGSDDQSSSPGSSPAR